MDPRIERVAQIVVNYSAQVRAGDWVVIMGQPVADPMLKAIYQEVLRAGGHPQVAMVPDWEAATLLRHGDESQLDWISPTHIWVAEQADVIVSVLSSSNTRALTTVASETQLQRNQALAVIRKTTMQRMGDGTLRWVGTIFPTHAYAQDAEMSLDEYEAFVYGAGLVDDPDPVTRWAAINERQQQLVEWLTGRDTIHIRGSDIDLTLSIKGRTFLNAAGTNNFPDGEIYTSPVETSASGWVHFTYPAVFQGQEVTDIRFWIEEGRVVKATASKNEAMLRSLLTTDAGANVIGELGIGTNPAITRFTSNTLFDEKIQGTIHLAVGAGFPHAGGQNHSAIHEDIVCDLHDGEIVVDGELFYKNGQFVV